MHIIIHGRGGSGKSTIAQHLQQDNPAMALQVREDYVKTSDWKLTPNTNYLFIVPQLDVVPKDILQGALVINADKIPIPESTSPPLEDKQIVVAVLNQEKQDLATQLMAHFDQDFAWFCYAHERYKNPPLPVCFIPVWGISRGEIHWHFNDKLCQFLSKDMVQWVKDHSITPQLPRVMFTDWLYFEMKLKGHSLSEAVSLATERQLKDWKVHILPVYTQFRAAAEACVQAILLSPVTMVIPRWGSIVESVNSSLKVVDWNL